MSKYQYYGFLALDRAFANEYKQLGAWLIQAVIAKTGESSSMTQEPQLSGY